MGHLAPITRDNVTDRDTSRFVTPLGCAAGERDGRDTHPIGGVTLSRSLPSDVEPLPPTGVSWTRPKHLGGKHSVSLHLSLRECDEAELRARAAELGVSRTAFGLYALQSFLAGLKAGNAP